MALKSFVPMAALLALANGPEAADAAARPTDGKWVTGACYRNAGGVNYYQEFYNTELDLSAAGHNEGQKMHDKTANVTAAQAKCESWCLGFQNCELATLHWNKPTDGTSTVDFECDLFTSADNGCTGGNCITKNEACHTVDAAVTTRSYYWKPPTTSSPTVSPTRAPTTSPTKSPTVSPTTAPTKSPTVSPTKAPTKAPTATPPTMAPTASIAAVTVDVCSQPSVSGSVATAINAPDSYMKSATSEQLLKDFPRALCGGLKAQAQCGNCDCSISSVTKSAKAADSKRLLGAAERELQTTSSYTLKADYAIRGASLDAEAVKTRVSQKTELATALQTAVAQDQTVKNSVGTVQVTSVESSSASKQAAATTTTSDDDEMSTGGAIGLGIGVGTVVGLILGAVLMRVYQAKQAKTEEQYAQKQ
jgi:hypothetical protein